ncbi:MAG: chitobiase/beta-hexosaminidase C-terminal domain-containing protein, partial [Verrucomicrobiales bacterium]
MSKKRSPFGAYGLLLVLSAALTLNSHAEFAISEFLADNSGSTLSDEDGFPADWIEIQNPDAAASINGYYLTDDPGDLTKWMLPDVTIGSNGYLVVFATGKNRTDPAGELHTNFALGAGGEFLALVAPDGQTIVSSFQPEAPQQYRDISYGIGNGGLVSAEDFVLLGAGLTYLVPESDIGSDWQGPEFDDASWAAAHSAVGWGYSSTAVGDDIADDGDLRAVMRSVNASVYLRLPFQVSDPAGVVSLTLKMKVDDGFVAFINGVKVAEKNAPSPLLFDSASTETEEVRVGDAYEFFPLNFAGALVAGENILAIQGLNDSSGSSDFIIIPELVGEVQDLSAPPQAGYFEEPTPGLPNGVLSAAPPNLVEFSAPSQAFTQNFTLSLSVPDEAAIIRYTEDGSAPSNDPADPSPEYTAPIPITTSAMIRARAFLPGSIDGPGRSEGYLKIAASEANFSSDLPVVLLSKFSRGDPPGANASTRVAGFMLIYEPDELTGRTTITGVPSLATRCGYRKRGSSSGGFAKYAMSLESWDEEDEDIDIRPLDFSPEGDWILNSRYTFDMALIRNPFLYELSNQVGRWAVKTQMIEIYHDATGGDVTSNDYFGVYCFMEKIEPDGGRLDIPNLNPWDVNEPEVTGGYVFKKDRSGVGEESINGGTMGTLPLTDPAELSPAQRTY